MTWINKTVFDLLRNDPGRNGELKEAVNTAHALTGSPRPAQPVQLLEQTVSRLGDSSAFHQAFGDSLLEGDVESAERNLGAALQAEAVAAAAKGHPQLTSLREAALTHQTLEELDYIRASIEGVRAAFNNAGRTFTDLWEHYADKPLTPESIKADPVRSEHLPALQKAAETLSRVQRFWQFCTEAHAYSAPSHAHIFTTGRLLPNGIADDWRNLTPAPGKEHGTIITLAIWGSHLTPTPRPGQRIELHWGSPEELEAQAAEYEDMLKVIPRPTVLDAFKYWSSKQAA